MDSREKPPRSPGVGTRRSPWAGR